MKVSLLCSASVKDEKYLLLAAEVSKYFAENKYELICGGASSSMLGIIYNNFKKYDCDITCNTLTSYQEDLICSKTILHSQTFDRLKAIYNNSDLIVVLPGGTGSLTEFFGILEEIRTQDKDKKIILFNYNKFYTPIIDFIDELINRGFNDASIKDYVIIVNNMEDLKRKVSEIYE